MKHIILIYFLLLTDYVYSQQNIFEFKKNKLELSLKLDGTKRRSLKYFDNDTAKYTKEQISPAGYSRNNFIAVNVGLKKYYNRNYIISAEFRYKLWGFEEYFLAPYRGKNHISAFGFSYNLISLDFSVNLMKRIKLYKRFELRPRIGVTAFYALPINRDSTDYSGIGVESSNMYYKGMFLKIGYNLGAELNYKLSNRFAFTISCLYYSPFNNTYNWSLGIRDSSTNYPWRKWAKKNDGLYFGLGVDFSLRKHYKAE